jgi:hypothetical protein
VLAVAGWSPWAQPTAKKRPQPAKPSKRMGPSYTPPDAECAAQAVILRAQKTGVLPFHSKARVGR